MTDERFVIKGKAFKFGDDVDTDQIIPARYLDTSEPEKLAMHCMEGVDKQFYSKVNPSDIIIAGKNFGCGSSREHAPLAIKSCGVGAVVAVSFARIFFRNAINIGLSIVECEGFQAKTGDEITIDLMKGRIVNNTTGIEETFHQFPDFLAGIISEGGLMEKIKRDIRQEKK